MIGSGIAGLSAAWLLSRTHRVTLYETAPRAGGHSNTVVVDGKIAVDTGFIVYNERNYPNLTALFDHLGVATDASDMSFSASLDGGRLEYSSEGLRGLLGQPRNAVSLRFWLMWRDVLRFYHEAPKLLRRADCETMTLGAYLDRSGYTEAFIEDHLLPMGAAIWSTTARQMRDYPLAAFVRFFIHHGLTDLARRPRWRTVNGGSRQYVTRMLDSIGEVRLDCGVAQIRRDQSGVTVIDWSGVQRRFNDVIIATHADQALELLGDADAEERIVLGGFRYTDNEAVLHRDTSLMPKRRPVWSSWNYVGQSADTGERPLCVTYWMNRLQRLETTENLFVTLNPGGEINADSVETRIAYRHPLFDGGAMAAQKQLWRLQGRRHIFYAGSYFGHGFHEDALQSGLAAAEALGGVRRPWAVDGESSRIRLAPMLAAAQ